MMVAADGADDGGGMGVQKVALLGQGYAGLAVAVRAVEVRFDVVGVDVGGDKVKKLGRRPVPCRGLTEERLQAALASGRYTPTTVIADAPASATR